MKLIKLIILGAAMVATAAQAQTITFDDLSAPVGGIIIPNGYGGLNWNNFDATDGTDYEAANGPSGYQYAVVSPNDIAYNAYGNPANITSPTPFTLGSGFFTAAWNNGLSLEVQGFDGASLVYDQTYTLNTTGPQLLVFNFVGITEANFISSGGTPAGFTGGGTHFAMDNLTLGSVPEPATLALAGIGAVAGLLFRRRK